MESWFTTIKRRRAEQRAIDRVAAACVVDVERLDVKRVFVGATIKESQQVVRLELQPDAARYLLKQLKAAVKALDTEVSVSIEQAATDAVEREVKP